MGCLPLLTTGAALWEGISATGTPSLLPLGPPGIEEVCGGRGPEDARPAQEKRSFSERQSSLR